MSSADLRDPERLLVLLQAALAAGLVGACSYHAPWSNHRVGVVRVPGLALRPGQPLEKPTCVRLCGASDGELTCNVVTIDIPPNPGALVRCRTDRHVPLPPELYEQVKLGEETPLSAEQCGNLCGDSTACVVEPVDDRAALRPGQPIDPSEPFVMCSTHYPGHTDVDIVGPLPSGRVSTTAVAFRERAHTEADYFARAAYYEAISVAAFRRLALTLAGLGAPDQLAARARCFARDEARHCRAWLGLLAAAHGDEAARESVRSWPKVAPPAARASAFELARENLLEGCIGESYGTWLALHQSRYGGTGELRRVAGDIVADEARHAALAFEVHAWLWPRLTGTQQQALRAAAARAIDGLARPLPLDAGLAARVGAPAAEVLALTLAPLQALLRRSFSSMLD